MATYQLPSELGINFTTGVDKIFVYIASQVPSFFPLMLFALFMIVLLGGYLSQTRKESQANIALWFTIAGIVTLIATMALTLIEGVITLPIIIIIVAITFASFAWLMFTEN